MAPPTIIVQRIPDACGFKSSSPSNDKLKMVGNIIELNRPTASIETIDTTPKVWDEINIISTAPIAKKESTRDGLIILVRYEPINRPIIAPLQ